MIISYDKIKKYKNLSSSQLEAFNFKNKNIFKLSQLLYRNLQTGDNGIEVGSINYIKKSEKIFMKAKALQAYNYLPVINAETSEFIKPNCFVNMDCWQEILFCLKILILVKHVYWIKIILMLC